MGAKIFKFCNFLVVNTHTLLLLVTSHFTLFNDLSTNVTITHSVSPQNSDEGQEVKFILWYDWNWLWYGKDNTATL